MRGVRCGLLMGCAALVLGACAPGSMGPGGMVPGGAEGETAAGAAAAPEPVVAAVDVAAVAAVAEPPEPELDPVLVAMYASARDGERTINAVDIARFDPKYLRQRVDYAGPEAPGTVVIDTAGRLLYFVEEGGTAMRYGVSIGREGFGWTGEGRIGRKAHWPRWTPPSEMIARDPKLEKWRGGMPGGPQNPLGARSLYIYFGEADSMYRVHGTNEPYSIGRAASSGCFRMLNQDVIDLYARVERGAPIVVR
jgi:lipoprotein-anchoring transpeptidase ErfK/SrfK